MQQQITSLRKFCKIRKRVNSVIHDQFKLLSNHGPLYTVVSLFDKYVFAFAISSISLASKHGKYANEN